MTDEKKIILFPGSLEELNSVGEGLFKIIGTELIRRIGATRRFDITEDCLKAELIKRGYDGVIRYSLISFYEHSCNTAGFIAQGIPIKRVYEIRE